MNRDVKQWNMQDVITPIVSWYEQEKRALPWRADCDPYHIWVSEIMLQQTRIEAVIPYYERFMKRLPNIAALAECEDEELHKLWEGLGYYSRVRNLKKAACTIVDEYGGVFPMDYDDIRSLPGIGDYTAGAIASMAFSLPRAAVDGNVLRVLTRIFACDRDIMDQSFRRDVTSALSACYPKNHEASLTQGLMELGEVICIPNGTPLCENCPVREYCESCRNGNPTEYPVRKPKAERRIEERIVLRIHVKDMLALHKRPDKGLLAGLWEYPNLLAVNEVVFANGRLTQQGNEKIIEFLNGFGIKKQEIESITGEGNPKHIFTHIEWHMHTFDVYCEESILSCAQDLTFVTPQELRTSYALPTAFKKCWKY